MTRAYGETLTLMASAGLVYALCQDDLLLPTVAVTLMFISWLIRAANGGRGFEIFRKLPLSAVIITSFIGGLFWRTVTPPPEAAVSPFPGFIAAVQAGSIIAAFQIWVKPFSRHNLLRLTFLAWLTVATSMNVPFTDPRMFMSFCLFCFIATALILLRTNRRPGAHERKRSRRYLRDFMITAALLIAVTTASFNALSRFIIVLDETYMDLVSRFITPRNYTHFLNINPKLSLIPPGRSALDARPVMEVALPGRDFLYARTQVFREFDDGTWLETDPRLTPAPDELKAGLDRGRITMFTSFADIIPSPIGTNAARGNTPFFIDRNEILYTKDEQRTRIVDITRRAAPPGVELGPTEYAEHLRLPDEIATELRDIAAEVTGDAADPFEEVARLRAFFKRNFKYSLTMSFTADNRGILRMITERRPAYCSYFATAMTLLARARGIPARVSAGFFTDEIIDRKRNLFLVRVKHAHAWSEVLLPVTDKLTGETKFAWHVVDPTPSGRALVVRPDLTLAEHIWLSALRASAWMENLDRDRMKIFALLGLMFFLALMNLRHIRALLERLGRRLSKIRPAMPRRPDRLRLLYGRYEDFLREAFGVTRRKPETDDDVVERLRGRGGVDDKVLNELAGFLRLYRAARFGDGDAGPAEAALEDMITARKEVG